MKKKRRGEKERTNREKKERHGEKRKRREKRETIVFF